VISGGKPSSSLPGEYMLPTEDGRLRPLMRRGAAIIGTWIVLTAPAAAQDPAPTMRDLSGRVPLVQALLGLDPSKPWRTNIWTDDAELILRAVPSDDTQETSRLRSLNSTEAVQARAVFDADGKLVRLRVRDRRRAGVVVLTSADAATRSAVLSGSRFPDTARAALMDAFGGPQRWWMLGTDVQVDDAGFAWKAVDSSHERALWHLRLTATRDSVPIVFIVSVDPVSGQLVELIKGDVQ
jgi:hypothetical protein